MEQEFYLEKYANNMNFFTIAKIDDPNKIEKSFDDSMDSNEWKKMLKFKETEKMKNQENKNSNIDELLKALENLN